MKKIFLAALLSLSASSAFADMNNGACFQPQNAIEFTLANGAGWNSAALSDITSTVTPTLTAANYFSLGTAPTTTPETFYSQFLSFRKPSLFTANMGWSGEFSIAGKFALGGSLFARLSAFIGANLGFSQAQIPVTGITVFANATDTGALDIPQPNSPFLTGYKPVTMKSGLGYGIMVGLGKETSFGSMSVDLGVVFRSFSFYFPSATAIKTGQAANGVIANQGLAPILPGQQINEASLSLTDNNTYGSYYNRFTQTGFRFGGSLSFKLIENLSFGISIAAEIFGKQTFTINPNLSSFSSTATTASTTTTTTTTDNSDTGVNTVNGKNINNTGMAYATITAAAKNVVTSVMMTLTYSVPVGN